MTNELSICTRIDRAGVEYDVVIYYRCLVFRPGNPLAGGAWDDPVDDGDCEFEFVSAAFADGEPDDAPGPLSPEELAALRVWFDDRYWELRECLI